MDTTFQNILNVKLAYYPLMDQGLVKDDDITYIIEELVAKSGYDQEQFRDWVAG